MRMHITSEPDPTANPFGIYEPTPEEDRAWAMRRVQGPAIAFLVIAGLQIALAILGIAGEAAVLAGVPLAYTYEPFGWFEFEGESTYSAPWSPLWDSLWVLAWSAYAVFAFVRMKQLRSLGHARAAIVIMMLPCISPTCCIGLGLGFWAWRVLGDDRVRAAFT